MPAHSVSHAPSALESLPAVTVATASTFQVSVSDLARIIATAEQLAHVQNCHDLTKQMVEFARDILELERVSLFIVENTEPQVVMRGTWGTDDHGCTIDERALAHNFSHLGLEELRVLHRGGQLWLYHSLKSRESDLRCSPWIQEDRDWFASTPLMAVNDVVGLFYNDTAISRTPLDTSKQAKLAIFGSMLVSRVRDTFARQPAGMLAGLTRDRFARHPTATTSRFIHKVLAELEREPQLSGKQLAQRFHVSPGHLARTFRAEVGTSLVEYRNSIRLERFFTVMQSGQTNLNEAALQAGFGSYAQFRRVHREITGLAPRDFSATGTADQ